MGNHAMTAPGGVRATALVTAVGMGLLVLGATWAGARLLPASPRVIVGWAQPNAAGSAMSLHESPDAALGDGYVIAGAMWRAGDGPWHEGGSSPTCVGTDTAAMTQVRLGVVTVAMPESGTREQVAWLQCLT